MATGFSLRPIVTEWVRALYVSFPLSVALKLRLKGIFFATFSPFLRNTDAYRAWREFEAHGQGLAVGMAGQDSLRGIASPPELGFVSYVAEQYGLAAASSIHDVLHQYGIDREAVQTRRFPAVTDGRAAEWIARLNALVRGVSLEREPVVSIIVPIYNQVQHTLACVESILCWGAEAAFEIIIADDCSNDPVLRHVLDSLKGIRIIRTPQNLGFLRNCNHAAGHARGRFVLFLNNDTLVLPGWLDALLAVFDTFPDAGLVGSKFLYPDGTVQEVGGIIWSDATACNYGRYRDPRVADLNYVRPTDYISGASIMLPVDLFSRLGGFDERYAPAYCEDSDLAFQVRANGFNVYVQPASEVVHFESVSSGSDLMSGARRFQEVNIAKLIERWHTVLEGEQFDRNEFLFLARDRSARSAHLLMIDLCLPRFDRDAGSRTIFQYARLFASHGIRVTYWPDDRVYDQTYARALQALGIEVLYGGYEMPEFDEWIRDHGLFFDYVLLSRPEISRKYVRQVREHSAARVLYYGHDLHHARFARELAVKGGPAVRQRERHSKIQELAAWRDADIVLYPSEEEREVVSGMVPGKAVLSIPAFYFDGRPPAIESAGRNGLLFVGSFRHSPNVDGLRWLLTAIWPVVQRLVPGVPISIVGSDLPDDLAALSSDEIRIVGYLSDVDLARLYRDSRVALAPLRIGAGVKGKVVESLWYGLPVATTTIGVQGLAGAEPFLTPCDEPGELAARIATLLTDDDEWLRSAHGGQSFVHDHFSVPAVVSKLRDVMPELGSLAHVRL
jgi:GT2 family glycosyltransferase